MADFTEKDLTGSRFTDVRLSDARLERVDFSGADLRSVSFDRATFRDVALTAVAMRGVQLVDVEIDGEIRNVTINGVDVVPLIVAELDRRDPDRVTMRPTTAADFRQAWDLVERRWDETVDRTRRLSPEQLHESVAGEWSFVETLRHLVFVTDYWVRLAVLGEPSPWDPLDLPWDEMPDTPGVPRDRRARPSLEEVLELRRDRMTRVRGLMDGLTEQSLDERTTPRQLPGRSGMESHPVRDCLLVLLDEEWTHRRYAERDLEILEGPPARD